MKCSNSTLYVTDNQHTVKVQTQKGICGTVLTVKYLPSGEHKKKIRWKSNRWEFSQNISDPLPTLQITFNLKQSCEIYPAYHG